MTFVVAVVVVLLAVALLVGAVAVVVRRDGYGWIEPPRSHPFDEAIPGRPDRRLG